MAGLIDGILPNTNVNDDLTVDGTVTADAVVLNEKATVPTPSTATTGVLWVRDDSPNVIVFTDSDGTDTVLDDGASDHTGNIDIGGNLTVAGTATLDGLLISNDGTVTTLSGTAGDYVRIGDANSTSHTLNSENDLLVAGELEVNSTAFFDGAAFFFNTLTAGTDFSLAIGSNASQSGGLRLATAQTPDSVLLFPGSLSNAIVMCGRGDLGFDFAHAQETNPTLFIHSANQATDEWLGLSHDGSSAQITSGKGGVSIEGLTVTNDGTKTTLSGTAGDYLRVGTANTTSHGLASENDLVITGRVEVNARADFDGNVFFNGAVAYASSGGTNYGQWVIKADDGLHFGIVATDNEANHNLVIVSHANVNDDYDHQPAGIDPTLFIHSATAAASETDEWISLTHNQTNGVIAVGTGTITLNNQVNMPSGGVINTGSAFFFGSGGNSLTWYSPTQVPTAMLSTVPTTSRAWIFCENGDHTFNFAHAQETNPTLFIHSANQATDEWVGLSHDASHAQITSGLGGVSVAGLNISNDGTKTTLSGIAGDYVRIGTTGTSDHGFNSEDDILFTGRAEFNSSVFVDAGVELKDDAILQLGGATSTDTVLLHSTAQTVDSLMIALGTESNAALFVQRGDASFNFAHADAVNPTIFVHSASQSTTEYASLTHDTTDAVISAGTGNIRMASNLARTTASGITANASQSQGQTPLTADINEISTVGSTDDVVTMPTTVAGMEVTVINHGANTLQIFPASGDNLGAGANISIQLEANEELTAVSYRATNWSIEASTQITHAEMTQSQHGTVTVIAATAQPHAFHTANIAAGDLAGWTFDAGGGGTVLAIGSVADGGGGEIDVETAPNHGLVVGDIVSISNTSDVNYDKVHVVSGIVSADKFSVVATFGGTTTGSVNHAATLTANTGQAGQYMCQVSASATSTSSNETFDFVVYENATAVDKSEMRRKFGTGADYGSFAESFLLAVADGDVISWTLQNNDSAGNITVRNFNINLIRL